MLARGRPGLSMVSVVIVVGITVMEECGSGHGKPHRESSPSSMHAPLLESVTSTWILFPVLGVKGEMVDEEFPGYRTNLASSS